MKKMIPLMLTFALLLSMSANVLASEVSQDEAVTAQYATTPSELPVISVDIKWEGMNFTYNGAPGKLWDATNHQYVEQEGGWAENEAIITITNHSDKILRAQFDYRQETAFENISMKFTDKAPFIGSAYTSKDQGGEPCLIQIRAVPVGDLPDSVTEETKIGSIQVTLQTEEDHMNVVGTIEGLYGGIPEADDQSVERGTPYYSTTDDKSNVENAYFSAVELIESGGEETEKNTALNLLLTSYYNALRIGQ